MSKEILKELNAFGQSVWLDNINRAMINNGSLRKLIGLGLRGITSNPTIFNKAISQSSDYDKEILELSNLDKSTFEIYDWLTIKDIREASRFFEGVYKETDCLDGYVSLEVNPELAFDMEGTIKEALQLNKKVNRPNVMFKIPATKEGCKAVEELIALGLNINLTLIFSVEQYVDAVQAYLRGMKRLLESNGDVKKTHSVASVFVSRIDTAIDNLLERMIREEKDEKRIMQLSCLKGKAAVSNSKLIYKKFLEIFGSDEFKLLKNKGVSSQRALWASTSTKNPAYSDIKYVTELIAKDTINTMPEDTFEAFLDHGFIKEALTYDTQEAAAIIDNLNNIGIKIDEICDKLLQDGLAAFRKSFESLLCSIEEKRKILSKDRVTEFVG